MFRQKIEGEASAAKRLEHPQVKQHVGLPLSHGIVQLNVENPARDCVIGGGHCPLFADKIDAVNRSRELFRARYHSRRDIETTVGKRILAVLEVSSKCAVAAAVVVN